MIQIKIFTIPIFGGEKINEEMNGFLRSRKVLQAESQLVNDSGGVFWSFCIKYLEDSSMVAKRKVDYKEVLDEKSFQRFAEMRQIRKQLAQEEGIPAYAIFTDEELAGLAGLEERTAGNMRKFFASIHHEILKDQLRRMFKDIDLLSIFEMIIDSYEVQTDRGLPIGNLSSQYFANHYLIGLDHFIKEQLSAKAYVRYMDDLVLWHPEREWLIAAGEIINNYVETKLQLSLKPMILNRTEYGLPFCGYRIYPFHIRLSQRSKRRYIKKMKDLDEQYHLGGWTEGDCQRRAQSLIAFTQHADARIFRKKFWNKLQTQKC